jgi:excisionase family DNA binding protein
MGKRVMILDEYEPYQIVTSDNRRFIVRAADAETAKRNAMIAGDTIKIVSAQPVVVFDGLLTAEELSVALGGSPTRETLFLWARQRKIPFVRMGRMVRFNEPEVRGAIERNAAKDQQPNEPRS